MVDRECQVQDDEIYTNEYDIIFSFFNLCNFLDSFLCTLLI